MKMIVNAVAFGAAGLALSACGVSDLIDEARGLADDPPIETSPVATSERIQNGEAITASHVAGLRLGYGDDTASSASGDALRFQKTGADTYAATLNGKTYTFTDGDRVIESDGKVYSFQNDTPPDLYSSVWSQTGELDELLSTGSSHVNVIGMQVFDSTVHEDDNTRIFAVVGAETPDSQLPTAANVTYSGNAQIQAYPKTGFVNNASSRTRYRGDFSLNTDFASGTVDGAITNLTEQLPGETERTAIAGNVILNEASMTSGNYAGTVSITGTEDVDASNTGTYSGGIFGPGGAQTGGVISLDGENNVANGYFIGTQN